MGRPQRAQHGRGRHRVGRSHDRAERDRRCPGHRRQERVADEGDRGGREANREDDQAGHRRPIVPEVSERRIVGCIEQHGRDEERQRKLGRDAEGGRAGKKRQQRAAERQEDRVRRPDAASRGRQGHGRYEQAKELFEFPHRT